MQLRHSIPDISLVVFNLVALEKLTKLRLKILLFVMLFLLLDVFDDDDMEYVAEVRKSRFNLAFISLRKSSTSTALSHPSPGAQQSTSETTRTSSPSRDDDNDRPPAGNVKGKLDGARRSPPRPCGPC